MISSMTPDGAPALHLPRRNSFVVGFLSAFGTLAIWTLVGVSFEGGRRADSPSGRYRLHIGAPLNSQRGGTYSLRLVENANESELRKVAVTLPSSESTFPIRDGNASIIWNQSETSVDVSVGKHPLVSISIPAKNHSQQLQSLVAMPWPAQ